MIAATGSVRLIAALALYEMSSIYSNKRVSLRVVCETVKCFTHGSTGMLYQNDLGFFTVEHNYHKIHQSDLKSKS